MKLSMPLRLNEVKFQRKSKGIQDWKLTSALKTPRRLKTVEDERMSSLVGRAAAGYQGGGHCTSGDCISVRRLACLPGKCMHFAKGERLSTIPTHFKGFYFWPFGFYKLSFILFELYRKITEII